MNTAGTVFAGFIDLRGKPQDARQTADGPANHVRDPCAHGDWPHRDAHEKRSRIPLPFTIAGSAHSSSHGWRRRFGPAPKSISNLDPHSGNDRAAEGALACYPQLEPSILK